MLKTAALCGVNRNTVGYWIRSKKLHAYRVGKNYSIPVEELLFYLKSTGQNISDKLADEGNKGPNFRTVQKCWQYYQETSHGSNCKDCIVFNNQLEVCFPSKKDGSLECSQRCDACQYYLETYFTRIQFIHQISFPVAVYKGFNIWGANNHWVELCGIQGQDLPGIGIEKIYHSDSLKTAISNIKKRTLSVSLVSVEDNVFLKNKEHGKIKVRISTYPLNEPSGAFLILAEKEEAN